MLPRRTSLAPRPKQLTEDGFTEGAARRALERIAAGPYGAQAVLCTKALRDYLHRAAERIAELKACINDERKFLRASKARRATLARFVTRNERDRTLSAARRAELFTLIQAAREELRHWTERREPTSTMNESSYNVFDRPAAIFSAPS